MPDSLYQFPIVKLGPSWAKSKSSTSCQLPIPNVIGKTYLEAARTNNNPPIPKPNIIGSQADRIGVKTAFTPIELVMKENTY